MPFGPVNALAFYTCMMGNFKVEWNAVFIECMTALATSGKNSDNVPVTIRGDDIFLGDRKLNSGTRSIIDDILNWSSNITAILIYLKRVRKVFQKYRVSFRLDKCDFLKDQVKFVGRDLLADGNCPVTSKFNMVND